MKFLLVIEMGNDAVQFLDRDIAPLLRRAADQMEAHLVSRRPSVPIEDANGNRVGSWGIVKDVIGVVQTKWPDTEKGVYCDASDFNVDKPRT